MLCTLTGVPVAIVVLLVLRYVVLLVLVDGAPVAILYYLYLQYVVLFVFVAGAPVAIVALLVLTVRSTTRTPSWCTGSYCSTTGTYGT